MFEGRWTGLENRYSFLGYTVEADLLLPELPSEVSPSQNAITVSAGSPGVDYCEEVHLWIRDGVLEMSCHRSNNWYRLVLPDEVVTHIDVRNLQLLYETAPDVDLPTLRHFLIDQALPRLIGHLGNLVLHGGGISKDDQSIVFLGDAGSGKSTLCASFLQDGWAVMSDDCLLVEAQPSLTVRGAYSGLRLYPETIARLSLQDHVTSPMAGYSDKMRICTRDGPEPGRLPFKFAVALVEGHSITLGKLSGAAALMEMVAGSFALAPRDGVLAAGRVKQYARLIDDGLRVVICHVPRDFSRLPDVKASILDAMGSLE